MKLKVVLFRCGTKCLSTVIINKLSWLLARQLKIISFMCAHRFPMAISVSDILGYLKECLISAFPVQSWKAANLHDRILNLNAILMEVERLGLSIKWSQIFSSVDHSYPHVMEDQMCVSTSSALRIRSYLNSHSTKRYVSGYSQ